ncbi:2'-5' RNA ligase family protein [Pontibacter roseus]|uniref:2'-5' RNA ligase family protein n=1 Tax=Pontibacter roseus TaxID=336989 RepID=UPI000375E82D|nr:2'-5' RNA ligase family protein [Pontibacter roseus]
MLATKTLKMNLTEHYNNLYQESLQKLQADAYQIDPLIDSPTDNRFGITLLIRPSGQAKANIQSFLNELKAVEPEQYYYPNSDIHITVMSIISCYAGFNLQQISVPDYISLIQKSLSETGRFSISFQGVTASDSGILIQGFPQDEALSGIRNSLRENFKNSGLQQSIDARYAIQTAHATVVRFRKPFVGKQPFLQVVEQWREVDFGTFEVAKLELVYNDWYQRERSVKPLHSFRLG